MYLFIKKGDKTDCSHYRGTSLLPTTYNILSGILLSRLTPHENKLMGIINVDFDATRQLLIIYSAFIIYLGKKWEHKETVVQFFIDFKKAYDSFRREVLYYILIKFGIAMKLLKLIKMCLKRIAESG